jgi:hypothetical protein
MSQSHLAQVQRCLKVILPEQIGGLCSTSHHHMQARAALVWVQPNAVDLFLTADPAKPVRMLAPYAAIVPFTSASSPQGYVSPIGSLVLQSWVKTTVGAALPPYLPTAADYKKAYETVMGGASLPANYDYFARTFPASSGAALAVLACDVLVPSLPTIAGTFLVNAVPSVDIMMLVGVTP